MTVSNIGILYHYDYLCFYYSTTLLFSALACMMYDFHNGDHGGGRWIDLRNPKVIF